MMSAHSRRLGLLARAVGRDAVACGLARLPTRCPDPDGAALRAVKWLQRGYDILGGDGMSRGYSLVRGWLSASALGTASVVRSLIALPDKEGDHRDIRERCRQLGQFLVDQQQPDGRVVDGGGSAFEADICTTALALHAWVDLIERDDLETVAAAGRAAGFLRDLLARPDAREIQAPAGACEARASSALVRWSRYAGDSRAEEAGRAVLEGLLSRRQGDSWIQSDHAASGAGVSTRAIASTMADLLQSHAILDEPRYVAVAVEVSEVLIRKLEVLGGLPARWGRCWQAAAAYECLIGTAQLAAVWLRLFQLSGDARFLNAALKATDRILARQQRVGQPDLDGALPAAFPVWRRFASVHFPAVATAALIDAIDLRDLALGDLPCE